MGASEQELRLLQGGHQLSRPNCKLAMQLNDHATDAERQRLSPFVTRLACTDTPAVEVEARGIH